MSYLLYHRRNGIHPLTAFALPKPPRTQARTEPPIRSEGTLTKGPGQGSDPKAQVDPPETRKIVSLQCCFLPYDEGKTGFEVGSVLKYSNWIQCSSCSIGSLTLTTLWHRNNIPLKSGGSYKTHVWKFFVVIHFFCNLQVIIQLRFEDKMNRQLRCDVEVPQDSPEILAAELATFNFIREVSSWNSNRSKW